MLASDRELPVSGGPEKRAYVREIFTAIAPTYDRLNRIISLRFDQRWRRYAVGRLGWERKPDGIYLDLCAGTLDFAASLATRPGFRGRIVAADFVPAMLRLGRGKAPGLAPVSADALDLPFPDAAFDGAMVGWGMRNLVDLDAGIAEAIDGGDEVAQIVEGHGAPVCAPFRSLGRRACGSRRPGRFMQGAHAAHEQSVAYVFESLCRQPARELRRARKRDRRRW
jgi:demethylmenaquinone methyltransferase/2-methoxy-6-polyprenyl-1,4-benzoquinol methylase